MCFARSFTKLSAPLAGPARLRYLMAIMARPSPLGFSVTRLSARWSVLLAGALGAALLLGVPLARGQEPKAEAPQPEAEEPKVIPAAEVAERAGEVQALLGEVEARAEPSAAVVA
ncbi:MAG: hypothetical protein JRS35_20245, partial [Deltaproteobacteria bacterium]|nr:hypothetical protein [Deltaproteobacteria bacterium]